MLWNDKDLTGWKIFLGDAAIDPKTVWRSTDGGLHLEIKASGCAKTEHPFAKDHLHVEWR